MHQCWVRCGEAPRPALCRGGIRHFGEDTSTGAKISGQQQPLTPVDIRTHDVTSRLRYESTKKCTAGVGAIRRAG